MKKTLLLAHRGFSGRYPENTPLAFRMTAEETDVDGIESDVHMTRDGALVIFHDDRVDRTSNGSGYIRDMTLDEMRRLDIGAWKDPAFAGEHVWTLEQLLDLCQEAKLLLDLELKNGDVSYPGMEQRVAELLRARKMQEQVFVSSFNHGSMALFKRLCPEVQTGLLYSKPLQGSLRRAGAAAADALHPRFTVLRRRPRLLEQCRAAGKKVYVWTVDKESDMRDMLARGVDGIISNWPDVLSRVAAEHDQ